MQVDLKKINPSVLSEFLKRFLSKNGLIYANYSFNEQGNLIIFAKDVIENDPVDLLFTIDKNNNLIDYYDDQIRYVYKYILQYKANEMKIARLNKYNKSWEKYLSENESNLKKIAVNNSNGI